MKNSRWIRIESNQFRFLYSKHTIIDTFMRTNWKNVYPFYVYMLFAHKIASDSYYGRRGNQISKNSYLGTSLFRIRIIYSSKSGSGVDPHNCFLTAIWCFLLLKVHLVWLFRVGREVCMWHIYSNIHTKPMVLISDGNPEHVAHAWRIMGLFWRKKSPACLIKCLKTLLPLTCEPISE